MRDNGAHIAGQKIFAFPDPEHQGAASARPEHEVGQIAVNHGNAVRANDPFQGGAKRLDEPALAGLAFFQVVIFPHQMRQDLGVGLGLENVAFADEFISEGLIVLDHPVVNQRELPFLVEMRMCVAVGHPSMRGPAGMTDADRPARRIESDDVGQMADAPDAFANLDVAPMQRGYARRVIAPVFKPSQAVEQDWNRFCFSDVSNNSTHKLGFWLKMKSDVFWRSSQAWINNRWWGRHSWRQGAGPRCEEDIGNDVATW